MEVNTSHEPSGAAGTGLRWVVSGVLAALLSQPAAAQQLVFSGAYTFRIPSEMSGKMLELADRNTWIYDQANTRHIDADGDGADDFIAVGLGAAGGYGAQIRYRLLRGAVGSRGFVGPWYWAVLTGKTGEKVYEAYNR